MIKSLHLTNFRRHADLELRFDHDKQLILIAGGNGAGKSTILEAVQFALWGEGRHGRRGLNNMVRRGSELEGMSVEMVFTVGSDDYRVHRRRDGKSSTAVLYVNDTPLAESPGQVTEEIASLMGMDAAGFKLAVVAQQKDLDGLSSMRPADRAQMITRLLRLDALTTAKNEAGVLFRRERQYAVDLRGGDVEVLEMAAKEAEEELAAAQEELSASQGALALLDAELAASSDVESAWQAASQAVARLEGAVGQLAGQLAAREAELAGVHVPEPSGSEDVDLADVSAQLAMAERAIALGEAAARADAQRQSVQSELDSVAARRDAVVVALEGPEPEVGELAAAHAGLHEQGTALSAEVSSLQVAVGSAEAVLASARARVERAGRQKPLCEECGQEVSGEHRAAQAAGAASALEAAQADLDVQVGALTRAQELVAEVSARYAEAGRELQAARDEAAARERLALELDELDRRAGTYRSQLERVPEQHVDVDEAYARKAELALLMATAQENARIDRERARALATREALRADVAALAGQLDSARLERDAAAPGADLEARHAARQRSLSARAAEAEMAGHWATQVAVATATCSGTAARLGDARLKAQAQERHQAAAADAGAAARLLGDVAERLSTQIRPSLEGTVGSILASMSGGRFASVAISEDYDIAVEDDGQMRALSELSGGEVDLVALATRLALSQVVSDRHGAGGAGFLVLDECFGSQDPQRRASILDALRALRDTYSQIFLISHVENIEDSVDVVVTVTPSDDRSETDVTVS